MKCKLEILQQKNEFVFYCDEIKFKSVIPVIGPSGSAEKQFETDSIQTNHCCYLQISIYLMTFAYRSLTL